MPALTPQLGARLVALGLLTVLIQVSAVSQVTIAGVNADLTPLAVMSVGLLCGSMLGATFGFAAGLFVDMALLQTLGLNSLVYIACGYGAGRIRELRDPQAGVTPLVVGALATAVATVGFSVMNFLLGVDAPVSFLLLRQIITTILLNTLIAMPMYALVRRWLLPALPDDPRRRRRRAYTTGGLSPLTRA
jgi:rod shape-determining protein MreD